MSKATGEARFAMVSPTMWARPKFRSLSDAAKVLWTYYLSCETLMTIPGVVLGGPGTHAERLGWSPKKFRTTHAQLVAAGFHVEADFEIGLVWLVNAFSRYQRPINASTIMGWSSRSWGGVPECPLKERIRSGLRAAVAPFLGKSMNDKSSLPSDFDELFPPSKGTVPQTVPGTVGGIRDQGSETRDQDPGPETETTAGPASLSPDGDGFFSVQSTLMNFAVAIGDNTWSKKRDAEIRRLRRDYDDQEIVDRCFGYIRGFGVPSYMKKDGFHPTIDGFFHKAHELQDSGRIARGQWPVSSKPLSGTEIAYLAEILEAAERGAKPKSALEAILADIGDEDDPADDAYARKHGLPTKDDPLCGFNGETMPPRKGPRNITNEPSPTPPTKEELAKFSASVKEALRSPYATATEVKE